jgi:antitoxin (DNA-binding transcriptional repressor) of toxin-antitoxin stability system
VPADPFNTAELRARVLDAWAASPARFREDANAEEDYALGGYRDRAVVELAQNAADAAARAGIPGKLRLTLSAGEHGAATLTAANTGAPLDAAGVESLSTLRASSKRDDGDEATVGRFGVGFAAVVAVSDAPRIVSLHGAVEWSRAQSAELAARLPALAGELAARSGSVPVLRLPFPAEGTLPDHAPPDGFDTAVILPLRDEAAMTLAERLLAQTGPALLLALPALAEVTIDTPAGTRVLAAAREGDSVTITSTSIPNAPLVPAASPVTATTWRTVAVGGPLDPALLADRPVEERARAAWSVRWAVPVTGDPATRESADALAGNVFAGQDEPGRLPDGVPPVVHAPTPSDEPLGLPALLLASFPLSPDRRHVAPGPLTRFLVERAADAYAGILPGLAAGRGLLDLVPGPVAAGELDVRLRQAILDRLPDVAFLPRAGAPEPGASRAHAGLPPLAEADGDYLAGGGPAPSGAATATRVSPRDALLLDVTAPPGLAGFLASLLPGLIGGPARHPAYAALGIRRLPMAELVDMLATVERPPSWWRGLYAALADVDPAALGELGALPVPLADGRLIRGPRGVLLPGPGLGDPSRLAPLRLRVAAADAAHPLLARLGALEATPRSVLEHPATLAAVDASLDEEDPGPIAEAVLWLVDAAGVRPGEFPWLADLALPTDDGEWDPAGDLLLPGGELAGVVAPDAFGVVDPALADQYGAAVLEAVGVLTSFGLLSARDVDLGDDPDLDLDGADDWAAWVRALLGGAADGPVPPVAVEVAAVRDLELVDPGRWPRALEIIASRQALRAALVNPTRVRLADGRHADVPSYTAWWLRTHPVLGGRRPADLRSADADPLLEGLYDPAADPAELGWLLSDAGLARALGVRASLAELLAEPGGADELLDRLADPARPVERAQLRSLWAALATAPDVQCAPPDRIRAVLGADVVVADASDVLVLDSPDLWPLVAGRPLILAPYDMSLALAELLDVPVASESVPGVVEGTGERRPVPGIVAAVLPDAPESYLAHEKLLVDGVPVPWRCADGEVHAGTAAGLACGLAWAAGQWHARHLLTTVLASPDEAPRLLAEADLDTATVG